MYTTHSILIALTCLLVSSCTSTVETITVDQDTISNRGDGYLLIGIETNRNLRSIELGGSNSVKLSHQNLRAGSNFILIDLPAGDYIVEKIDLNRWYRLFINDEENWTFTIKPQTISYVGHLEIANSGFFRPSSEIELVNRSTEAVEFMEDFFPSILESRVLYYGGPGNDIFFDVINGGGE